MEDALLAGLTETQRTDVRAYMRERGAGTKTGGAWFSAFLFAYLLFCWAIGRGGLPYLPARYSAHAAALALVLFLLALWRDVRISRLRARLSGYPLDSRQAQLLGLVDVASSLATSAVSSKQYENMMAGGAAGGSGLRARRNSGPLRFAPVRVGAALLSDLSYGGGSASSSTAAAAAALAADRQAAIGSGGNAAAAGRAHLFLRSAADILREQDVGVDGAARRGMAGPAAALAQALNKVRRRAAAMAAGLLGSGGAGAAAPGRAAAVPFARLDALGLQAGSEAELDPVLGAAAGTVGVVGAGPQDQRPLQITHTQYQAAEAELAPGARVIPGVVAPDPLAQGRALTLAPQDRLELYATELKRFLARHIQHVFIPALRRNTQQLLEKDATGMLTPGFLQRRLPRCRVPFLRPGLLTLDEVISEMTSGIVVLSADKTVGAGDARFLVLRPRQQTLLGLADVDAAERRNRAAQAGGAADDGEGEGEGEGEAEDEDGGAGAGAGGTRKRAPKRSICLWEERANLEAFLAPPHTGGGFAGGGGAGSGAEGAGQALFGGGGRVNPALQDAKYYAQMRLEALAQDPQLRGSKGDDWGMPEAEARAAGLPTDAQLLSNYFFRLMDAAVAEAKAPKDDPVVVANDGGTAEAIAAARHRAATSVRQRDQPFTRYHVVYGPLQRTGLQGIGTGAGLEGRSDIVDALLRGSGDGGVKFLRLHLPSDAPKHFRMQLLRENEPLDLSQGMSARQALPVTLAAFVDMLMDAPEERHPCKLGEPAVDVSQVLRQMLPPSVWRARPTGAPATGSKK